MSDLLTALARRVDAFARAEVGTYIREFPEYAREATKPSARAEMLEYAVWSRRRTIELVGENRALEDEDVAFIAAIGRRRANQGLAIGTAQQVLALHANMMLREIHEAAEPNHLDDLLHLAGWFGAQGARGTAAFLRGYLDEQQRNLPAARRLRTLTELLLAGDPAAPRLAESLGMRLPEHYLVTVVGVPGRPEVSGEAVESLVETVFQRHCLPVMWQRPNELVALIPDAGTGSLWRPEPADDRPRRVVHDVVAMMGRPCRVGTATAPVSALTDALELARRVAAVAPAEKVPHHLYGVADVFVELSVAQVPEVDRSLRAVAQRLAAGPDLVTTLDAYYRNNMSRLETAAALHIHPRTLDYRLQRVRELVDVDPTSVRGVRILSTTVNRTLSGAWN